MVSKYIQTSNFMKNLSRRGRVFPCGRTDRQTDGRTDVT